MLRIEIGAEERVTVEQKRILFLILLAYYSITITEANNFSIAGLLQHLACTVVLRKSCELTLQINSSQLAITDDTCTIFQNATMNTARSGEINSRSGIVNFHNVCFQDLMLKISNQVTNFKWNRLNASLFVNQKHSLETSHDNCDFPLLEISEKMASPIQENSGNISYERSRNSRHINDNVKRNRAKKSKRSRRTLKVLQRQSRQCKQLLQIFVKKRRKIRHRRSAFAKICRITRKLRRHCLKIDIKRNKASQNSKKNKTELSSSARRRSDQKHRKRRSASSGQWKKSLQLCQVDYPNGGLTLNVFSENDVSNKSRKFFDDFPIVGGQGVVKFEIKRYRSNSDGTSKVVFEFIVPDQFLSSNSSISSLRSGEAKSASFASNTSRDRSGVSKVVVCVFTITGLIAIAGICGYCAKNRYKSMQRSSSGRNLGSGDTYSERSSVGDSHEMELLGQIRSSNNNKHCMKVDSCRHNTNQQLNNNMPAYQNSSITNVPQGSKKGSRKKNKQPIEYSSATGTAQASSKFRSPEKQYFEPFSSLTGSSNRTTNSFNDRFHRRFNNNPQRQASIQSSSLRQYSQFNFPPPVRRYPSKLDGFEITKSASQLNSDPNRFQTPPNRRLIKTDGNQIISLFEDQLCIQHEPGSCAATNSAPPICSPLTKSSNSDSADFVPSYNNNTNFATRNFNHDPPPEYSEPPSYYP